MSQAQQELNRRALARSDINEHLHTLARLASECHHVTEFGHRLGNSTVAFIAGIRTPGTVVSYDINPQASDMPDRAGVTFKYHRADTSFIPLIERTELLLIDTLHDFAQVVQELQHAQRVSRYLVFHDTVLFGTMDESTGQPPGIMRAVDCFMSWNLHWSFKEHRTNNNGLLILERVPS